MSHVLYLFLYLLHRYHRDLPVLPHSFPTRRSADLKRSAVRFNGNVGIRLSDAVETRFYATISHINQDLPGSLTLEQALTTPKLSRPDNITKDQERDIDSIRLQNSTAVDLGNGTLAFGPFYNSKHLFYPIYEVIYTNSVDGGIFRSEK